MAGADPSRTAMYFVALYAGVMPTSSGIGSGSNTPTGSSVSGTWRPARKLAVLRGHQGRGSGRHFSADGKRLVTRLG